MDLLTFRCIQYRLSIFLKTFTRKVSFLLFLDFFCLISCRPCTLRCQINDPPLINFSIFPASRTLLGPPFITFKEIDSLYKPLISFLLVEFTPNFHGKMAYSCKYFSSMRYDNLFLFFPSLYNHLKPFLKFQPPPVYFDPVY